MGLNTSQPATQNQITDSSRNATNTTHVKMYFGPRFVLPPITEDNLLSDEFLHELIQTSNFLPSSIPLNSYVNLRKKSIEIRNGLVKFTFDSLQRPCTIRFYFFAKDVIMEPKVDSQPLKIKFVTSKKFLKVGNLASDTTLKFGPFKAGLNQTFSLPSNHPIDIEICKKQILIFF
jgi:hypothetical protein